MAVVDFDCYYNIVTCNIVLDVNGNYAYAKNQANTSNSIDPYVYIGGNNYYGKFIAFPNGSKRCSLSGSRQFNGKVTFPKGVTHLYGAFRNCQRFNQNIQIPNSVTNTYAMFQNCSSLNQNIQIPNSVIDMNAMFQNCSKLNQNIKIPNSVTSVTQAFMNCWNLSDITIEPIIVKYFFSDSMIRNTNQQSINIWTDLASANRIMATKFIQGGIKPTMTAITNGYYNAYYNVYIYTNAFS